MREDPRLPVLRPARSPRPRRLSRREREVVDLIVAGHPNRNIADVLGISEETVKVHIREAFAKTGCSSRLQLAIKFAPPAASMDVTWLHDLLIELRAEATSHLAFIDAKLAAFEYRNRGNRPPSPQPDPDGSLVT